MTHSLIDTTLEGTPNVSSLNAATSATGDPLTSISRSTDAVNAMSCSDNLLMTSSSSHMTSDHHHSQPNMLEQNALATTNQAASFLSYVQEHHQGVGMGMYETYLDRKIIIAISSFILQFDTICSPKMYVFISI